MRSLHVIAILSLAACATTASTDNSDQLDAPTGKADGALEPAGIYSNTSAKVGELTSLVLNADHTYTRDQLVECVAAPCAPVEEHGTYLLTHGTSNGVTKHYIRFYAEDGTALDRFQWQIVKGELELALDSDPSWFTMTTGGTCEQAGGTCAPLVPDACELGTVGDANQYSCGGGVGVECCLPQVQANGAACTADTDCAGLLPQFCRACGDGSSACAHWSCVAGTCQVATCQ